MHVSSGQWSQHHRFFMRAVYISSTRYIPATIVALTLASQAAIIVLFCKLFQEDRLVASLQKRKFIVHFGIYYIQLCTDQAGRLNLLSDPFFLD